MSCIGPLMLLITLMLILILATSPSQSSREEEVGVWLHRPGHVSALFKLGKKKKGRGGAEKRSEGSVTTYHPSH